MQVQPGIYGLLLITVSRRRICGSAIVHKPANKKVDCMLSASGTVTQATRPSLSRAILTTPAAGELAPSDEALDSILLRWAMATPCSSSSRSEIPVGALVIPIPSVIHCH